MSGVNTAPDSDVAVAYIRENFELADRLAVVVLNKRTNSVIQRIAAAEKIMEPDFQNWLRDRNGRDRSEIYLSMNALHPNAQGRKKEDVSAIRHIYLDFDMDGTAAIERLLKRGDVPKPNYLINTSPNKWQVIWKVEGFEKNHAEQLQRRLACDEGADLAATDCARVLRLPGFQNHKYALPNLIRVETLAGETYRSERFPMISTQKLPRCGGAHPPRWSTRQDSLSQSERDWAYAKRALARGESPATVTSAIASHRRYDKPHENII